MKLSSKEDVDAPIAAVYAHLSDFDGWERAALRRGAEVRRSDALTEAGRGMAWTVGFSYRGKPRRVALMLTVLVPPSGLGFSGTGANLDGVLAIDLIEMAPRRTRISVKLEIRPRTLVARLFVQSLKLARARVDGRFRMRVAQVAAEIEDRFARGGGPA